MDGGDGDPAAAVKSNEQDRSRHLREVTDKDRKEDLERKDTH